MLASPLVAVGMSGSSQFVAFQGSRKVVAASSRYEQANSTGRPMANEATQRLVMVGLSHAEVPLSLLERVVAGRDELPAVLTSLRASGFAEAGALSTCSRFEVYAVSTGDVEADLLAMLERRAGAAAVAVRRAAIVRTGPSAVQHLFRVTSGFESPVIGEIDI